MSPVETLTRLGIQTEDIEDENHIHHNKYCIEPALTPKDVVFKVSIILVILTFILRRLYKSIPEWIKKARRPKTLDRGFKDANDDLANPVAILGKLRSLMQLASEKVDDDLPWYKIHACFLSFLHMQKELFVKYPDFNRDRYTHDPNGKLVEDKRTVHDLIEYCGLAELAYETNFLSLHEALKRLDFDLLRHDVSTEPGRVGHFVAVDHGRKTAVVAIKGTSSFSDALTDVLGHTIKHKLTHEVNGIQNVRVHEGMYTAARMILDDTQHLVKHLFLPQGYDIVICGHSLGAGVSCLLGLFLHANLKGEPNLERLRVLAFATPACLDFNISKAIAPFTTSVVNNTDCVPRLSIMNLVTLNKYFVNIDNKLETRGMSPKTWSASKALVQDLTKTDDVLLMEPDEILRMENNLITCLKQEDTDHALFVPGKVLVLWKNADGTVGCVAGDGGLNVMRHIEMASTMMTDHSCSEYMTNLVTLRKQVSVS